MSPTTPASFDLEKFLHSSGVARTLVEYGKGSVLYAQGDPADSVLYIQNGRVQLAVLSTTGKEAIIATLGPGDFVGEGALADQPVRMGTARAVVPTTALVIDRVEMKRVLHEQHALSDRFIAYMLARNLRVEADLVDQLFNHSEKRLARALLLLARYGKQDGPHRIVPRIRQDVLAGMVGTTRSRVNVFMNKFKKLGFIEYNHELKINSALLTVVLHD